MTDSEDPNRIRRRTIVISINSFKKYDQQELPDLSKYQSAARLAKTKEKIAEYEYEDFKVLQRAKVRELPERQPVLLKPLIELNPERGEGEEPVHLSEIFTNILKEHQLQGVRFLWRNVVQEAAGGALAHSMGLGKTVQVICFLHSLFANQCYSRLPPSLKRNGKLRVLILCPPIVINNWENEVIKWLGVEGMKTMGQVFKLRKANGMHGKTEMLNKWRDYGGLMLCGYQMFREVVICKTEPRNTDAKAALLSADLVVCDEGHVIKNEASGLSKVVKELTTPHRICLTGYPLQNNLKEYWCMIDFCRPQYLPHWDHFNSRFVKWIVSGLYKDATEMDRRYAMQKLYVLTIWLDPIVYRKDATILHESLPPKHEYRIDCKISQLQRTLYERFLKYSGSDLRGLFAKTNVLTRIVNHPGALKLAIDADEEDEEAKDEDFRMLSYDWTRPELSDPMIMDLHHSPKMTVAIKIIELAERMKEKVLIFSRSICTLDYITNQLLARGIPFYRIDGSVEGKRRQEMIDSFLPEADAQVFILSSLAGSLGINLTAASRVILFDAGWNPCHDEQAIGRCFRYGQSKPVHVYRLCAYGTMESRLYNLNVFKVTLSVQAVDRKEVERRIKKGDLKDYFMNPEYPPDSGFFAGPSDALFSQLLDECSPFIVQVLDHQKTITDASLIDLPDNQKEEALKELDLIKKKQESQRLGEALSLPQNDQLTYIESFARDKVQQKYWQASPVDEPSCAQQAPTARRFKRPNSGFEECRRTIESSLGVKLEDHACVQADYACGKFLSNHEFRGSGSEYDPIRIEDDM